MATLQKIRNRGPLLIIVIGIALFAFIIGDFLTQGSTFLNRSRENVGEVNDHVIKIYDYQEKIDQLTEIINLQSGQVRNFSEMELAQLRDQVWNDMVNELILKDEAEKLGIVVTKEELSDRLIGNNIHPMISQNPMFYDENGIFNRINVIQFLDNMEMDPGNNEQMRAQLKQMKNYWLFVEDQVKKSVLSEKYSALIGKSIASNSVEVEMNLNSSKETIDLRYITKPYFTIPDSLVSAPTSTEIKDLYAKKKEQYKQKATRTADYISFDIRPMQEDYETVENLINSLKDRFATASDVSNVVNVNSDISYTGRNYSEKMLPTYLREFAFSGKKDDVFGPVFEDESYLMARIIETGISTPDSVRMSYIYLTNDMADKKDSLINEMKKGADFAAISTLFSADKEAASNGGDIGWITENMQNLNPEILKAFSNKVGDVFTIQDIQGTQIFKITEKTQSKPKVKIAILQRHVTAGSNTKAKLYNEATQFLASVKTPAEFSAKAEEKGYFVRSASNIGQNDIQFVNYANSRPVVKWIYESNLNDISSKVFECDDSFIITLTTEINKEGYKSIESVTPQLTADILRDKKAEYMINLINNMSANDLESIAEKLELDVKEAEEVSLTNTQLGSSGTYEPAVVGIASKMSLNTLSSPIKGLAGVYVVQVSNKSESNINADSNSIRKMLDMQSASMIPYILPSELNQKARIIDNRSNFY